jgi:hypothetical protein
MIAEHQSDVNRTPADSRNGGLPGGRLFFIIREKKRLKPSRETAQSIDFRREESIFYSFLPPRKKRL